MKLNIIQYSIMIEEETYIEHNETGDKTNW